jgi:membrane protein CcdC involved in cytochrome C biogenesis
MLERLAEQFARDPLYASLVQAFFFGIGIWMVVAIVHRWMSAPVVEGGLAGGVFWFCAYRYLVGPRVVRRFRPE